MFYFLLSHFLFLFQMPSSGSLDTRVWNFLEASILHVRSQKYYGIPYFFTNNSGIPHYFIMEFHIKNKLWKSEIKYYCPFISNFHSCSEPRIVLNWGHILLMKSAMKKNKPFILLKISLQKESKGISILLIAGRSLLSYSIYS